MLGPAFLGFAVAVAFWPGLISAAVVPRWALLAAGLPLVSWLDPRRLSPVALGLLGAAVLYAALSLAWAPDPVRGVNDLIRLLILGAAMLVGANLNDIGPVMRAMAWGVAVSCVLAIVQMFGWSIVAQAAPPAGLFYNRDFLAEIAAVFFVWAVLSREWAVIPLLLIPLAVSGSRIALIGVAAGFMVLRPRISIPIALVAITLIAAVTAGFSDKVTTIGARLDIWRVALGGITLWGNGLESFTAAYPASEYAHSDFFQSLYELGIGALPLLVLLLMATWQGGASPLGAAMACVLAEYFVAFPLHLPTSAFVVGLLAGHLVRHRGRHCRIEYLSGGLVVPAI